MSTSFINLPLNLCDYIFSFIYSIIVLLIYRTEINKYEKKKKKLNIYLLW
jgi:hypothetical protein